ncbi:hypothetical protein [Thermosynechococcus sp.]|uniref:hypothetical protein n=1 Tax=Thermosynechococcus sp. TaxID=2814275 RepID=UPI00391A742B
MSQEIPPPEAYVVLGLAHCFVQVEGKLQPVEVIEPIPSAALEALFHGLPTSYSEARALSYGTAQDPQQVQQHFPPTAHLCDDYGDRLAAAARTYIARPQSTRHIPLGETYRNFNTSTERKRVLNSTRIVTAADNVKQHAYTHQVL